MMNARPLGPVAFLDRTYDEAIDLLTQLRDYLNQEEAFGTTAGTTPAEQLTTTLETTRMTAMMTSAVAWLMLRKAVGAGELTPEEAAQPENRLAGRAIAPDPEQAEPALPPELKPLHARCRGLYARVARLDEMVARDAA